MPKKDTTVLIFLLSMSDLFPPSFVLDLVLFARTLSVTLMTGPTCLSCSA